jgi:hypothetical protein
MLRAPLISGNENWRGKLVWLTAGLSPDAPSPQRAAVKAPESIAGLLLRSVASILHFQYRAEALFHWPICQSLRAFRTLYSGPNAQGVNRVAPVGVWAILNRAWRRLDGTHFSTNP